MSIIPSESELKDTFNVDPVEFKKHVNALNKSAKKLADMGFYIFGGNSAGMSVSNKIEDIVVAELDGDYNGGVGDDLIMFESQS